MKRTLLVLFAVAVLAGCATVTTMELGRIYVEEGGEVFYLGPARETVYIQYWQKTGKLTEEELRGNPHDVYSVSRYVALERITTASWRSTGPTTVTYVLQVVGSHYEAVPFTLLIGGRAVTLGTDRLSFNGESYVTFTTVVPPEDVEAVFASNDVSIQLPGETISLTQKEIEYLRLLSPSQSTDFSFLVKDGALRDVQAAISNGADVNARNVYGSTPLIFAAGFNPDPAVTGLLLKAAAEKEARETRRGRTALMCAVKANPNPEVIATLLAAGADPDAQDQDGWTALMHASNNQNTEAISMLLRAGADAKAKSRTGRTAFEYAQKDEWLKGTDAYRQLQKASQ
jgi:hypothetical protein